jgi:hypothetical protein
MNKRLISIALTLLVTAGCNSNSAAVVGPPKTFFGPWAESGGLIAIDFTDANQNGTQFTANYFFNDQSYCVCTFEITLTNGSGEYSSGTVNSTCGPGIAQIANTGNDANSLCPNILQYTGGTYTHNGNTLVICQPESGPCLGYQ